MHYFKVGICVVAVGLFVVPQVSILTTHASFLTIANEPIAYRYFLVARLDAGAGGAAWLPQGQLTSLIQRGVFLVVESMPLNLWDRMDAFGLLYGFVVVGIFAVLLVWIAANARFSARDVLLVGGTPITMAYLLGVNFHYTTQADYQHLNMVLFAAAVSLFIYQSRVASTLSVLRHGIASGILLGLCASNKVSLTVIAGAATTPLVALLIQKRDRQRLLVFAAITAACAIATAAGVLLGLYAFDWRAARDSLRSISSFAADPGEIEPWFLGQMISATWQSHYLPVFLIAAATAGRAIPYRPSFVLPLFAAGAVFVAFIWHRPAGSTAFDAACAMIAIAAMALSVLPERTVVGWQTLVFTGALSVLGWINFPGDLHGWLVSSREKQEARVELLHEAEQAGHPIIAVVPDNNWASGGPLSALLKGFSTFPTWEIPAGRTLPIRGTLTYRTTYSGPGPERPYPPDATIMWEDVPGLPRLTDKFPALAEAVASRDCRSAESGGTSWICLPRSNDKDTDRSRSEAPLRSAPGLRGGHRSAH